MFKHEFVKGITRLETAFGTELQEKAVKFLSSKIESSWSRGKWVWVVEYCVDSLDRFPLWARLRVIGDIYEEKHKVEKPLEDGFNAESLAWEKEADRRLAQYTPDQLAQIQQQAINNLPGPVRDYLRPQRQLVGPCVRHFMREIVMGELSNVTV